jgi:hypothetical protein
VSGRVQAGAQQLDADVGVWAQDFNTDLLFQEQVNLLKVVACGWLQQPVKGCC